MAMRLYNIEKREIVQHDSIPSSYVIASHRWTPGSEITFQDVQKKINTHKGGYKKLQGFADYVQRNLPDIKWLWIDTCCIDKTNSVELSEALNRMFVWYRDASVCLAYLEDVYQAQPSTQFQRSEWFKRGWTLQELIAPRTVVFLTSDWKVIGHKGGNKLERDALSLDTGQPLESIIASITGIPEPVLLDSERLAGYATDEKLKWIQGRRTKKEEDMSYSLFGILNVAIVANYGEGGEKARRRLLREIEMEKNLTRDFWGSLAINTESPRLEALRSPREERHLAHARHTPSDTHSEQSFSEQEQSCLEKLSPEPLYGRQSNIDDHTEGTLTWLAADSVYTAWRTSHTAQLLLVTGYAGCGKSVIASYVARSLAGVSAGNALVCQYFFDGTVGGQSDTCKLLRSLVYQIVVNRRKLLKIVRKRMARQPQILNDFRSLWTLFQELATHPRAQALCIVIDAIDECEATEQESMACQFVRLMSSTDRAFIKVLMTSRPYSPAVASIEDARHLSLRLALEERSNTIKNDVSVYIQEQVARFVRNGRFQQSTGAALQEALERKSEATFLWVPVALSILSRRRIWRQSELIAQLDVLPWQLSEMYEHLLAAIPQEDQELAIRTLRVMCGSMRQLTLDELNAMISINSTHRSLHELRSEPYFTDIRLVEKLLEGLIKVSDNRISLIHHTLKEFLASRSHDEETDQCIVAEICMRYLLMEDFQVELFGNQSPDSTNSPDSMKSPDSTNSPDLARAHEAISAESDTDSLLVTMFTEPQEAAADAAHLTASRFELFDYAARFWPSHYAKCQLNGDSLRHLALQLHDAHMQNSWYRYLTSIDSLDGQYPRQPDALTLACFFGHFSILSDIASKQASCSWSSGAYWAAKNGHTDCVKTIFSITDLNTWSPDTQSSPLHIAAACGHTDIIRFLLSKHIFSVNQCGDDGRSPLSLAASGAFCDVMSEILKEDDLDPNIIDSTGATAIFWAVSAESLEAVRLLHSDKRTNTTHTDARGRSALSWACEYGQLEIVRVLSKNGQSKQDEKDVLGRTPLVYAVLSGNLDLVRYLLRHALVDVSQRDTLGRGAISWAAQRSNPRILESLLKKNAHLANIQDVDGWTPLEWTLDPPERVLNAKALIPHVINDLDDQAGLALFSLAISWKAFAVAELMLSSGMFHVNTTSSSGRTAISFAAQAGNSDLVQQLLKIANIDATLVDHQGFSPYSFAAAAGHDEICRLIQESHGSN